MSLTSNLLARGPGWWVEDVVCSAGPEDRPFEERHGAWCIAAVSAGTFRYRTPRGAALMVPGALLLGEPGVGFECSHVHHRGDRCLSFHFDPGHMETLVASIPGLRRIASPPPQVPPGHALLPLLASAEAARDDGDTRQLEECGALLALCLNEASVTRGGQPRLSAADERRAAAAARLIAATTDATPTLADLSAHCATSPYHLLRVFARVVGMTPRQYALRQRLARVARALAREDGDIVTLALAHGAGDVSTFMRQFRRAFGMTPASWRARTRGAREATRARMD